MSPAATAGAVLALLALAGAAVPGPGHGGVYRGPADGLGPGSVTTGGPSSSSAGAKDTDDAAWDQWWSFNRDAYLALEDAVFGARLVATPRTAVPPGGALRPAPAVLENDVVPALLAALDGQRDVDMVTGILLALAKIGMPSESPPDLGAVIRSYLPAGNQEVHESAAIALGVLGDPRSAPALADMMLDTDAGRRLVDRAHVPDRTRAFATYGLGLVGARTDAPAVRTFVAHQLGLAIELGDSPAPDRFVAAVISFGLVPLESRGRALDDGERASPASSREGQVAFLREQLERGRLAERSRAFLPVALARLSRGAAEGTQERLIDDFVAALEPRARTSDEARRAILLAAGLLGDNDEDRSDVRLRSALLGAASDGDRISRNLALLALARGAGREGKDPRSLVPGTIHSELMRRMARGTSAERPWAALALGLLERANVDAGRPTSDGSRLTLRDMFANASSPSEQGAVATALGLVAEIEVADDLLERATNGDENLRGQCAVALGLMGAHEAAPTLRGVVAESRYRPGLVREAAIGLALLGEGSAATLLVDRLRASKRMLEQLASAVALGHVGDARSVGPLLEVLADRRLSETTRAFAAAALGNIADQDRLRWNAPIAEDVPWWAAPPTLHDPVAGKGVLDIL